MTLKKAILEQLSRDNLKAICQELDIAGVDLRSAEEMRRKLSRLHRVQPTVLLERASEEDVKAVAERMGMPATGRRAALVEMLLADNGSDRQSHGDLRVEDVGAAPAHQPSMRRRAARGAHADDGHTEQYRHNEAAVQRPDVGIQDQFQAKKPPRTYRYDSSLDPALSWDEQTERDLGEWLLGLIERATQDGVQDVFPQPHHWRGGGVRVSSVQDAVRLLIDISKPFLNWAGKAERPEVSVPTVPLFIHERHSTKAILDGIRHRKARGTSLDLFGDQAMDIRDLLEAYEHKGPWQNRMILGDSLLVMNSLLEFEGLAGQVQMIYVDPPYGVKFGSNFQPFVRRRDVKHGADDDMTREPEMVTAYRDTWQLGLHSYLTYLRDRIVVARDLLHETGSIFVQISDENLHHLREVLDEVFGADNFMSLIQFVKTSGLEAAGRLSTACDYLLWYARRKDTAKYRPIWLSKDFDSASGYTHIELQSGSRRRMTTEEAAGQMPLPPTARVLALSDLTKPGPGSRYEVEYNGRTYSPGRRWWGTTPEGMEQLKKAKRLEAVGNSLRFVRYLQDFPVSGLANLWEDTGIAGFTSEKLYVVQTNKKVVERCLLMTTDPGDLVLDPTCGSGTTAYVAEQWGRRWVTTDTSRVPLALARQRLLTATFAYYELKDPARGPAGGFVYKRNQNRKGHEIGGLVPHITLKSIVNDEQPAMEVLVDRPEEVADVTRVTGPFVVEAMIAPAQLGEELADGRHIGGDPATHVERMTEVLKRSKTLRLPRNRELVLADIRRTTDAEYLHAEARDGHRRLAIVFGPQNGALSASLVYEAAREAHYLKYDQIYFFGFAIEPNARSMIEEERKLRISAAYVAVTPDVAMSDLLKTTRASEIFSITGLPDFEVRTAKKKGPEGQTLYEVELRGLDIFDPESFETESVNGQNLPCWMLDTAYDGMSFHASQVFFPKTSAWDNLQKSLRAVFDETVWEHLAGTVSEPFALGERKRVAVKVIDERGNELLRVQEVQP